jgi:hypothetical protein
MAKLDNEEVRTAVKHYVRAAGVLTDAWIIAGYKTRSGFTSYLEKHPDFHAELNDIKYFSDPSVNVALIKKAHQAVEMNLEHGAAKKISDRDPETGKMILNRVIQTGASKWAVEMVLRSPTVTETALKMVLASQIYEISRDPTLTTEVKTAFYHFLDRFKRLQLIELIQKGCPVKEDVE